MIKPSFTKELGFCVWRIKVGIQKINGFRLKTFEMVITSFLIIEKVRKSRFFIKTFLFIDISMDVALGMLFFTLSNVEINFMDWELNWKLYIIVEVLATTKEIKLIKKKKFKTTTLNLDDEIFVVYMTSSTNSNLNVYLSHRAQVVLLI